MRNLVLVPVQIDLVATGSAGLSCSFSKALALVQTDLADITGSAGLTCFF